MIDWYSFFEKFFNVFTRSEQNNGENILQTWNSEYLEAIIHDGNCFEDFLPSGYSQVVKTLFVSVYPFVFFATSSRWTFYEHFTFLIRNYLKHF